MNKNLVIKTPDTQTEQFFNVNMDIALPKALNNSWAWELQKVLKVTINHFFLWNAIKSLQQKYYL